MLTTSLWGSNGDRDPSERAAASSFRRMPRTGVTLLESHVRVQVLLAGDLRRRSRYSRSCLFEENRVGGVLEPRFLLRPVVQTQPSHTASKITHDLDFGPSQPIEESPKAAAPVRRG